MKEIRTPTAAADIKQGDLVLWRGASMKVRLTERQAFQMRLVIGGAVITVPHREKLIVLTYKQN